MCGLVGAFGNISNSKVSVDIFHSLLIVNQLRGSHSTGVAKLRLSKSKPLIEKALGDPACLFANQLYPKLIQEEPKDLLGLIGHGRHATKGDITIDNAHPFKHEHITVTHNGTVWDTGVNEKFDTDSEAITFSIAKKGIRDTWQNIRGAAALVWWNSADHTLNMLTNGERPLCYVRTEDERIFWASEADMLRLALNRANVKIMNGVMVLQPHYLFTWKWTDNKLHKTVTEMPEPKPYTSPVQTNWVKNVVTGVFGKKEKKKVHLPFEDIPVDKLKDAFNKYELKRPVQVMNFGEFQGKSHECSSCSEPLVQKDFHQGVAFGVDELVCKTCTDLYMHMGWSFYHQSTPMAMVKADEYKDVVNG